MKNRGIKIVLGILAITGFGVADACAQQLALKSNLLYDVTATMSLGVEVGLSEKWTLDMPVSYNPWKFGNKTRLKHWGVQPELRYWLHEKFDRLFIGLHAHYVDFNVGGWPDWSFISSNMQENRYQGHLYGGGISFGRSWNLKKHWSLEASLGLGYARIIYDKYPCAECGEKILRRHKNYWGPTKASVSLIYTMK